MPRLRRLPAISFGWYYVAMHAVDGRRLVTNATDLDELLKLLRESLTKNGARLHAGSVTSGEVHLVLQSGERAVQEITHAFGQRYARLFNRRHGEGGSLFQSHPHVVLIQHSLWLVRAAHVVHWIPRIRSSEGHISWSSDASYRGAVRQKGLTTHAVLHLVGHGARSREVQTSSYRARFDQPPSALDIQALARGSPEDSRILGTPEFVLETWRATKQRIPHKEKRMQSTDATIEDAMASVLQQFIATCQETLAPKRAATWMRIATPDQLRSHSRKSPLPLIRARVASHVIDRGLATQAQVAQFFGCHPKTLSTQRRQNLETRLEKLMRRRLP